MTGRDGFPRAGYPNGDPHERPADLAAVQADDALLDLLGSGGTPSDASDELTRVLAAWRREVHADPIRELVDTNTALAVIRAAARAPVRGRSPVFGSIAAAAAVLVIAFSAVGLVAKQAQPGDHLWGVTQVLYSDYARSVETAVAVRTELNEARTALQEHKPEKARASLQRVQQQLPVIGETEGRTDLTARHRELEQILKGAPDGGSGKMPAAPVFPPFAGTGARPETTTSPKSTNPPTSVDSTTTSNPPTEPRSTTSAPPRVPPARDYPHRRYPGPASPGSGSPGSGSPDGASSGSGSSGSGSSGSASPSSGPPSRDSSAPGPTGSGGSAGSGSPDRYHAPSGSPAGRVPPGCVRPEPQPPYCR
jgi:uncharacterized membrane protein YgcG